MAEYPKTPSPPNELEREFAGPLVQPETDEGMGSTLGEDVSAKHQRDEDKRNNAGRA